MEVLCTILQSCSSSVVTVRPALQQSNPALGKQSGCKVKLRNFHTFLELFVKCDLLDAYGSNSPKREFTLIYVHKPVAEMTSNGHKKCNLKSVKG